MFFKRKKSKKYFFTIFTILCCLSASSIPTRAQQQADNDLFLVAQKAFEDGFYDVAIRYINQLLQDHPQTDKRVQASLLLGQCYFFLTQYLKAYDIFQGLLSTSELKDATLFWLGETYLKGSDYKQAENNYKQVIELYPNSAYAPQALYSLGWVYYEQNDFDKAKTVFSQFLKKYPAHQLSEDSLYKLAEIEYNLHNYENTIQLFKNYIVMYPESHRHAESYFYIGESYYYLNDYLSSISYYAKTSEIAYDNKLALMSKVSLGWCYINLEKFDLAQKAFQDAEQFAKEKNITSEDIPLGQANLAIETKDFENAQKFYTQLIGQFPNSSRMPEALLGLAHAQYELKDYSGSIAAYQKFIEKFSNDPQQQKMLEKAYFGVAWAYLKAGKIDESIKNFETIKDQTDNKIVKVSALTQIADAYQDIGLFDKAVEVYDKILSDYSENPYIDYVQYRLGIALLKMDKIEAATLSFQTLQNNFPESKYMDDISYYLAVAYFKKGDWISAKDKINVFISSKSRSQEFLPDSYYIRALSYFNLNDYRSALSEFQNIIKNFPDQKTITPNAEMYIAKCFYRLGDATEGVKKFLALTEKYPGSAVAQESLLWVGDHYLGIREYDNAIVYYSDFIKNYPGSDKINLAYFELAQAYQAKGDIENAIKTFKLVKGSPADEVYIKSKLSIADLFAKDLDPQSAIQTYENIISSSPEFQRDAYLRIAAIYKENKEYDKAMGAYQNALSSKSSINQTKNAEIQFSIADALEQSNQNPKAIEEYLKIPYLYPNEVPWIIKAYLRMAKIFEDGGQWEEAKLTYNKVIQYKTEELKFAQERLDWIKTNIK